MVDLGPCRIVEAQGSDVGPFLHRLLTADLATLPVGGVRRTARLDDRGRIQGVASVARTEASRWWIVPDDGAGDAWWTFLDTYLFSEAVELRVVDVHLSWREEGRPGVDEVDGLPRLPHLTTPSGGHELATINRCDGGGRSVLDLSRIRAGRPRWPVDAPPSALPHEMGWVDELVAFGKGCYIGQEAVHRIAVRGGVKRVLVGLALDGPAEVGSPVRVAGVEVGRLGSSERDGDGFVALAVVRKPHDAVGTEVDVAGVAGRVVRLPMA